jgi:hypothetical protein
VPRTGERRRKDRDVHAAGDGHDDIASISALTIWRSERKSGEGDDAFQQGRDVDHRDPP